MPLAGCVGCQRRHLPPVYLGMEEAGRTTGTSAWAQRYELPQGGHREGHGSPNVGRKGSLREGRRTMARPAPPGPKTQTDTRERPTHAALFRHFTASSALPTSFTFCFGPLTAAPTSSPPRRSSLGLEAAHPPAGHCAPGGAPEGIPFTRPARR